MIDYLPNYRCCAWRLSHYKIEYNLSEIQNFFDVNGSNIVKCINDLGRFKKDKYYRVICGEFYSTGYIITESEATEFEIKRYHLISESLAKDYE